MSMQKVQRQMPAPAGREAVGQGEAMPDVASDEAFCPRHATGDTGSALLRAALTTENLRRAFKRVRANKGAAGVDGLDINQTSRYLASAWPSIREQLLSGTYRPSPVRRVTIPNIEIPEGCELVRAAWNEGSVWPQRVDRVYRSGPPESMKSGAGFPFFWLYAAEESFTAVWEARLCINPATHPGRFMLDTNAADRPVMPAQRHLNRCWGVP